MAAAARPALLAHALHLTRDLPAAEDLVQDTYVRMMERPPHSRSKRKVQAWLMLVMRHLWADRFPRRCPALTAAEKELFRRAALRGGRGSRELVFAAGATSLDALN